MKYYWFITLLLLSLPASAVELAEDGIGSVLLFPYYVARGGNTTLLSITTGNRNAVKVNFFEGDNGVPVLSFNLYNSGTWTATISLDEQGDAWLRTNSRACTVPDFFADQQNPGRMQLGQDFLATLAELEDTGRNSTDRIAEGHIEVISMGRAGPPADDAFRIDVETGRPVDCRDVVDAWNPDLPFGPGIWTVDEQATMSPPTNFLSGEATIINVNQSRAFTYPAIALKDFYVPDESMPPSLHSAPDSAAPRLDQAFPAVSVVNNARLSLQSTEVREVTDTWNSGLDAVEAVLTNLFYNGDLNAETSINAYTEWVLTQPTRSLRLENAPIGMPNEDGFVNVNGLLFLPRDNRLCDPLSHVIIERNSLAHAIYQRPPPDFFPPVSTVELCNQITVVNYRSSTVSTTPEQHESNNTASDILASRLFETLLQGDFRFPREDRAPVFTLPTFSGRLIESGRLGFSAQASSVIDFTPRSTVINPISGNRYIGLPLVGFNVRAAESSSQNVFFAVHTALTTTRLIEPPP